MEPQLYFVQLCGSITQTQIYELSKWVDEMQNIIIVVAVVAAAAAVKLLWDQQQRLTQLGAK